MALLTDATVIVEARESSGSLYQAAEALRLGRPLFLLESAICDVSLSWPKRMLDQGAQVLSRKNLAGVIQSLLSIEEKTRVSGR